MSISKLPEYSTWTAMKRRCYNPNWHAYHRYGGRGIMICDRWLNSFQNFYGDMGPRPVGYEIERKNNDIGYSPDNCEWASRTSQSNNTSASRKIEFKGTTKTLSEWAKHLGISRDRLAARIDRLGMTLDQAFTSERLRCDGSRMAQSTYTHDGMTMSLCEWSRMTGIKYGTLWARLKRGSNIGSAVNEKSGLKRTRGAA